MFYNDVPQFGIELSHLLFRQIGQVLVEPSVETVEDASLLFSGPQFFIALIAGVVLAFAIQLLLTNLGVAAGISLAGGGSSSSQDSDRPSESLGGTIRKIGFTLGLGTLISVTLALFFACLLAVKLSLLASPGLGAIVGLVIWATYFSLLVFFSSSTVGSLIGSVVNTATSGFQALMGAATAALGGAAVSRQTVATVEAAASAVRRELTGVIDPMGVREKVEEYLEALRPPELNLREIRQEFEQILNDPRLKSLDAESLQNIDRQTFVDLVSSRTDLSKRDANRIANQLESVWRQTVNQLPARRDVMGEFTNFLRSAAPQELLGNELSQKVDDLIGELRSNREAKQVSPLSQGLTLSLNSLMGLVMGRSDLSDLDVEKILNQLKQLRSQVGEQANKIAAQVNPNSEPYSALRADVENYLLNTYSWQMKPQDVERDFRDILYDPSADPELVADELRRLNRSNFVDLLQQRGVFTQDKIRQLSNLLEAIRLEVLSTAEAAVERLAQIQLLADVEQYLLYTPPEDLTSEKIRLNFKPILQDQNISYGQLSTRLAEFDAATFQQLLEQRGDLTTPDMQIIIADLEKARNEVLEEAQHRQALVQQKVNEQWLKVKSYLRDTNKAELDPDSIEEMLKTLVSDPQIGLIGLRERLSHFDRDTLVQLLATRKDMTEAEAEHLVDRVERTWTQVSSTPGQLAGKAKEQYDQSMAAIADYLRNTGKSELNPEGIRRDLSLVLQNPQLGFNAIKRRLAQMDRDTLVKLLSQRQDLSEDQVNQTIDEVQSTLRSLANAPQRLAKRTQQQVQNFQTALADYLYSTEREELNPAGIRRDLQLLLHDPRVGLESLRDRLSQFDRETLVALLSQRQDMTPADAERVADQIWSVREQFMEQLHTLQARIKGVIDSVLVRIRDYLNSLDRPELNYEGIRHDLRTLFDDPQAGFDALRDRLSQFDRNTLVAVLSSREDISEADANRIIDQIENTRNRVLQRAERLQMQAQTRLEQVKREAQHQLDETRKAAATAAWWLFFTAIVSAAAAAGAGALAVAS